MQTTTTPCAFETEGEFEPECEADLEHEQSRRIAIIETAHWSFNEISLLSRGASTVFWLSTYPITITAHAGAVLLVFCLRSRVTDQSLWFAVPRRIYWSAHSSEHHRRK